MDQTDRSTDGASLQEVCTSLGHRAAVIGGCLVALLALFQDSRVSTAAMRGGLTYLAVLLIAKWGFAALQRAHNLEVAQSVNEEETAG